MSVVTQGSRSVFLNSSAVSQLSRILEEVGINIPLSENQLFFHRSIHAIEKKICQSPIVNSPQIVFHWVVDIAKSVTKLGVYMNPSHKLYIFGKQSVIFTETVDILSRLRAKYNELVQFLVIQDTLSWEIRDYITNSLLVLDEIVRITENKHIFFDTI